VDSVRLGDGGTATLRATSQEGENQMHGGRLAATVAASPVLVWMKGKNVQFERGVEITAYIRGNIPVDETRLRASKSLAASNSLLLRIKALTFWRSDSFSPNTSISNDRVAPGFVPFGPSRSPYSVLHFASASADTPCHSDVRRRERLLV
jgi:hypothetical protein